MFRILILFLFFLSGFTGLVYEIVWTRIFGLIFGNTTLAISTVLSAFMLGLALGSIKIGRYSDRVKNHLKLYAFLELGVGCSVLLLLILKGSMESFYAFLYPSFSNHNFIFYLLKFVISFLIMLPGTFLMGGTLPVISHIFIKEKQRLGDGVGLLYSVNTFGAVIGTFLTGFYFIRLIGVYESVFLAVFFNIAVAVIAFATSFFRKTQSVGTPSPPGKPAAILRDSDARFAIYAMAISGFAALSYEVLWSRVLVFALTNSVYAFSVMLTTFLLGIAIGSLVGGKIVDRTRNMISLLGWVEILIGVTAFITAIVLVNFPDIHYSIFKINPTTSWTYWNGIRFLEAVLVMFLPTFFMGISFPVASKIIIPRLSEIGDGLGLLYFFNTLGGVVGSFLTGFIFITFLGTSVTMAVMVAINVFVGFFLISFRRGYFSGKKVYAYVAAVIMILLLLIGFFPKTFFANTYSLVERNLSLVSFREGIEGTVTVHRENLPLEQNMRIDVDGLNVAGNSFMLQTLQLLQGHLPNMVQENAEDVLQIGFGTGQTSRTALLYPIKNFTLVEISKDVMDLGSKYFKKLNQGVTGNPKFKYFIFDGKNYVEYTSHKYDIIMNDANYAVATASASLFTRDHFENCRDKLRPGGILSTWMTTDLDPQDFEIVLKTFQSVFPYSLLWMAPNCINKQVVLMGSGAPIRIDFQQLEKTFSVPDIKNSLSQVNINSVYDLLSCLVLDSHGIEAISKNAPVNSDDHPVLEFSTRAIRARDLCALQNLAKITNHPPELNEILTNLPADSLRKEKVLLKLGRYQRASHQLLIGMLEFYQGRIHPALETLLNGSRLIPESELAQQFFKKMDDVTARLAIDVKKHPENLEFKLRLIRQQISQSRYDPALKSLKQLSKAAPDNPVVYYEAARCYLAKSEPDSARAYLQKSIKLNPNISGAWYFSGIAARKQNKLKEALAAFAKALEIDPRMYEAYNEIANIQMRLKKYQAAVQAYKNSLKIMEFQPETVANMAKCYFRLKNYSQSILLFRQAAAMGSPAADLFFNLGNAYYVSGNFKKARVSYLRAIQFDSSNAECYYNLGNSFVQDKDFRNAALNYRQAIELDDSRPDYYNNLALSYRETGNIQKAVKIFEKGLGKHADSALLRKNLEETRRMIEKE